MKTQYESVKRASPGYIIFFIHGNFAECYFEDAKRVSSILGLTLTTMTKNKEKTPMAGFPKYQLQRYTAIMLDNGLKVMVLETTKGEK